MSIDIGRAASFLAAHGRVLDRRRFALLTGGASPTDRAAVLAAVEGYRNGDGGYSWGIEPDLRAPESQPAGALHALEAIGDAGVEASPATTRLFDWLDSVTLPDGGLPFALPIANPVACAPSGSSPTPRSRRCKSRPESPPKHIASPATTSTRTSIPGWHGSPATASTRSIRWTRHLSPTSCHSPFSSSTRPLTTILRPTNASSVSARTCLLMVRSRSKEVP